MLYKARTQRIQSKRNWDKRGKREDLEDSEEE